jgi:hypothetical protein
VSIIGTNVTQSLAGLAQAEKIEAREKRPEKPKTGQRRARTDEYDHVTVETETADALRGLASNDQEEAREDRQEHPQYDQKGAKSGEPGAPHIDIQG